MPRKVYVLDTSAVIAGFVPGLAKAEQATVQEVLEEASDLCSKLELETAVAAGKVRVVEPARETLEEVGKRVAQTGDLVSAVDIKLLALALDLKRSGEEPELVTDDYAIQNLASLFDIPYQRIVMPGIKEVLRWEMVCPACNRRYTPTTSQCEVCGSMLVRKPRR
ncbi:tRNA(fMet)-specific endonuclease VapC [subsurface metagenome]